MMVRIVSDTSSMYSSAEAEAAKAQLKELFEHATFELLPLTPAFTTHGGPGCVAIQAVREL